MLHETRLLKALEAKREGFQEAELSRRETVQALSDALDAAMGMSVDEIEQRLADIEWPGAHPTAEHEQFDGPVVPFAPRWANHREAREWALQVLQGVPTFAADGSQIPPTKDISVPVAVVQVGWFENRHLPGGDYVKDVALEVLSPDELRMDDDDPETGFPDQHVNWRRFDLEVQRLIAYMEANAGATPRPLAFFDGSLVVSFAGQMAQSQQRRYTTAIRALLAASEATGVPVVGFVDTSYATDLTVMLARLVGFGPRAPVSDAALLGGRMAWGERSHVYVCARDDGVTDKYYDRVCFTYLKTNESNAPARIDFPRWVYEAGEHERMLDLVRAECVVGAGYPYPLETADATAVLTFEDRERFYRLFQQFAERSRLPLRFSRKAVSKRGRRI